MRSPVVCGSPVGECWPSAATTSWAAARSRRSCDVSVGVLPVLQTYRDRIARYASARQLDIWYALIVAQQFIALFVPEEQKHAARRAFGVRSLGMRAVRYPARSQAVQSSARLRNNGCSAG